MHSAQWIGSSFAVSFKGTWIKSLFTNFSATLPPPPPPPTFSCTHSLRFSDIFISLLTFAFIFHLYARVCICLNFLILLLCPKHAAYELISYIYIFVHMFKIYVYVYIVLTELIPYRQGLGVRRPCIYSTTLIIQSSFIYQFKSFQRYALIHSA